MGEEGSGQLLVLLKDRKWRVASAGKVSVHGVAIIIAIIIGRLIINI